MKEIDFIAFDKNRKRFMCRAMTDNEVVATTCFRDESTKYTMIQLINNIHQIEEAIKKKGGHIEIMEYHDCDKMKHKL